MTLTFARQSRRPDLCCICGRTAAAKDVVRAFFTARSAFWVCADETCQSAGETMADTPASHLTSYEELALLAGGDAAGAYLDGLNKTDLAALSPQEFSTFLRHVLDGYAASMRRQLSRVEIPF